MNIVQPKKRGVIYVTKAKFGAVLSLFALVMIFGSMSFVSKIKATRHNKVSCLLFSNQADAQKHFDSDPKAYAALDRNHNGKACEKTKYR